MVSLNLFWLFLVEISKAKVSGLLRKLDLRQQPDQKRNAINLKAVHPNELKFWQSSLLINLYQLCGNEAILRYLTQ